MNVLYLINYAGKAGTEKYVENLVAYLHPHKCRCSLAYNVDGPLAQKLREQQIPTFPVTMKHPLDLSAAKRLAAICRENAIDIIHAQYPRENILAILAQRYGSGAKVIFTSHLTIYQPAPWRLLNRIFTPKDACVISVCNEGRAILEQNRVKADRIEVIFNGIDAKAMPPHDRAPLAEFGIGPQERVVSILARFAPEKGLDFLCRSLARLKAQTQVPFRVLLMGDGDLFGQIQQTVEKLGLAGTVILTGFRTDTNRLLAASDVYLNTSRANEAMSFAILEALANGLPVVATDVGGNRDLVTLGGVCGQIVPFGDEDGFAAALQQLLEDDTLRAKYSQAARAKTETTFALDHLLEEIYQVYCRQTGKI